MEWMIVVWWPPLSPMGLHFFADFQPFCFRHPQQQIRPVNKKKTITNNNDDVIIGGASIIITTKKMLSLENWEGRAWTDLKYCFLLIISHTENDATYADVVQQINTTRHFVWSSRVFTSAAICVINLLLSVCDRLQPASGNGIEGYGYIFFYRIYAYNRMFLIIINSAAQRTNLLIVKIYYFGRHG